MISGRPTHAHGSVGRELAWGCWYAVARCDCGQWYGAKQRGEDDPAARARASARLSEHQREEQSTARTIRDMESEFK